MQTAGVERLIKWVVSALVTVFFLFLCAIHDQSHRGHELYIRNWLAEPVAVSGRIQEGNGRSRYFLLEAMPNSLTQAYLLRRSTSRQQGTLTFETGQGFLPYVVPLNLYRTGSVTGPLVVSLYPDRFYVTSGVPSSVRPLPIDLTLERFLQVVAVFGGTFTFIRWLDRQARRG